MATKNIGTVVQIMGPVLDIRFDNGKLPELLSAIEVYRGDEKITVEVAQHIGDDVVRCVAMSSTDGLERGIQAIDTGKPISVPVGEECLGRMFNLLGRPIDNMAPPSRSSAGPSTALRPPMTSRRAPPRSWKPASRSWT